MLSHSGSDNSGQAAMFVYGSIDDHMFDGVSSFFYFKKMFFLYYKWACGETFLIYQNFTYVFPLNKFHDL